MENIRRVYFYLKKIYNINILWKYQNLNIQIIRTKIKLKKQLKKCLAMLKVLSLKLAIKYKIIIVKKKINYLISHGIYLKSFYNFKSLLKKTTLPL